MEPPIVYFSLKDHHKVYFLALREFLERLGEQIPVSTKIFKDVEQWEKYLRIISKFYGGDCTKNEKRKLKKITTWWRIYSVLIGVS